jgi:hypothetical protein
MLNGCASWHARLSASRIRAYPQKNLLDGTGPGLFDEANNFSRKREAAHDNDKT